MSEKTGRKKYTYEEVYEIFKSKGYKLLDEEYVGGKTRMKCVDDEGYMYAVSLDGIRARKNPSKFGRGNPFTDHNIDVCLSQKENQYKRLTYGITNTKQNIDVVDSEGYKYRLQVSPLVYSNKKLTRVGNGNYWSIYNINLYMNLSDSTDKLLTTEFINQNEPLDWICEHGHRFHTNWNNYLTRGQRCGECAKIARMYTFEECVDMVSKRQDYKLLDMERRKNNRDTNVIYYHLEHECGYKYWVCKQAFDGGTSCEPCAKKAVGLKKRDSEDLIRRKIEDETDFEYKYIKSKFVRNNQDILRRRINIVHKECGKEYWVDYGNWNTGNRCSDCVPIESYAVPYDEWKDRIENKNIHNLKLLDVYYKVDNTNGRNVAWLKLKCSLCNEEIDRAGNGWRYGCPSCTVSKGEGMVRKFLDKHNVKHTQQMQYDGLVGVGGGNLSYDFYLEEYNLLIEYQGEFHDGNTRIRDKSYLPTQQEHDRRKREYAEQQGIDLLEIWYWDFDNIESILKEKLQLEGKIYCEHC